jgi:archaellum component FlaF (FlaF/FlaG flagellin family)
MIRAMKILFLFVFMCAAMPAHAAMTLVCSNVGSTDVYISSYQGKLTMEFTAKAMFSSERFSYGEKELKITNYAQKNTQVIVGANKNGLFSIECPDLDIMNDDVYNEECVIYGKIPEIGFSFGGYRGRKHTCRDILHTAWSRDDAREVRHQKRAQKI